MKNIIVLLALLALPIAAFGEKLKNTIDEGSTAFVGITTVDKNGNPVNADTMIFWVNDSKTGELLMTPRTPAPGPTYPSSMVLTISTCASRIITQRDREEKDLTVYYTYGSGTPPTPGPYDGTGEGSWDVIQLTNLFVGTPNPTTGICGVLSASTPTPTPTP